MQTENLLALLRAHRAGDHLKLRLFSNPGPFPFGPPATMGRAQYIGMTDHLILTLVEDAVLPGLLGFQADCPMTPDGQSILWCGGVSCQPYQGDIWYMIHALFVRDIAQLLPDRQDLQLQALITGINGQVSGRQYWLVEVPAITREVLLNIDEISVVRRRRPWRPNKEIPSKVARGEFWQTASFTEHPIYDARRDG